MRSIAVVLLPLLVSGCGGKYKPKGPVLSGWERSSTFEEHKKSQARYSAGPVTAAPVLPLLAFGAAFDVDIVLRSNHENWDMHEYARIDTPSGPLWMAMESRAGSGDQYIVADLVDIDLFMPEIPVERKSAEMTVTDDSNEEELKLTLSYENFDGDLVEVSYQGTPPTRYQKKRNGNAMGHSRNQALAVLDIPHRESGFKASLKIGKKQQRITKVAGILPFQFALEQTQGGLAVGRFSMVAEDDVAWEAEDTIGLFNTGEAAPEPESETEVARPDDAEGEGEDAEDDDSTVTRPDEEEEGTTRTRPEAGTGEEDVGDLPDGEQVEGALPVPVDEEITEVVRPIPSLKSFSTVHNMPSGNQVEQEWEVYRQGERVHAVQRSDVRTLDYSYIVNDEAIELANISVHQFGRGVPTAAIQISPPIPDLRRPFNGKHTSRYVIDVNGQRNHAVGTIEAWWSEAGPRVKVVPESPEWTAERGMLTSITLTEGGAEVHIERVDD
jgi:hypothetical protein